MTVYEALMIFYEALTILFQAGLFLLALLMYIETKNTKK
ncbi:MAG: putative holin-like toxin [Defluviitaleaceae bacterium]|nr:putative holin-like toxin [Defluviitaleaceae bacterium]